MLQWIVGYAAALLSFVIVDFVWLSLMVPRFYRVEMGDIALSGVNLAPAVVFYAVYPAGVLIFAAMPAVRSESASAALIYGALLGFFAYATYDLTNYATLRNWTLALTVVDIAWGTLLTAVGSIAAYLAVVRLAAG
jgi:uncharacterized membrane protein